MLSVSDSVVGVLQTTVAARENNFMLESRTGRRGEAVERKDVRKAGFLVEIRQGSEGEKRCLQMIWVLVH